MKRLRLSKYRQGLVTSHQDLVQVLAKYFLQNRPHWQRSVYIADLEGEGYLALCKAARTYDKTRLPYPKAYFARAILNSMLKHIKRATRQPGMTKISLQEAADLAPEFDHIDHLRLAIDELTADDRAVATDRFVRGSTLRTLAEDHQIPLRVASLRASRLAKQLAESLDIRLQPHGRATAHRPGDTSRGNPSSSQSSSQASSRHRGEGKG